MSSSSFATLLAAGTVDAVAPEEGASAVPEEVRQVQALAQTVFLTDTCAKLIINGAEKCISLDAFIDILNKSVAAERSLRTEDLFLPSNTFYVGRVGTNLHLNTYHPSSVRNLKYMDENRPSLIPNIIISQTLESKGTDWLVTNTRYFCTDLPLSRLPRRHIGALNQADRIFLLPFTNTYERGNMCYGGNTMPIRFTNGNLRGMDWYYEYLFESPFNDDLGLYALSRSTPPRSWYDELARLGRDGGTFPYDRLNGFTPLADAAPQPSAAAFPAAA